MPTDGYGGSPRFAWVAGRCGAMPEGDSLVRLADRLRPVLEGQELARTDFRVPRLATLDLAGLTVRTVQPWAKYLLIELNGAEGPGGAGARDLTVLSHLRMEGRWEAYPLLGPDGGRATPRWRHPGWQARCVLETARDQVVGFSLGLLEVLPRDQVAQRLEFLGPDLLDPGWQQPERAEVLLEESVQRLKEQPDRPIGLALLDQRLVSGIGNIYRCEALLLAGLDPHRPVSSVPDLPGLIALARDLMRVNTAPAAPGRPAPRRTTTAVVPDPSAPFGVRVLDAVATTGAGAERGAPPSPGRRPAAGPRGRDPLYWVYGSRRDGCLRCGGPVTVEDLGEGSGQERTLYWCRHCQR
ncbi:DNA-formamidopyrimidine glycosylase family protein [Citricoccus nitrophenolicus]|uniref:DNA-formamidopyrimidine glycosylase family protein n=1 Tax=Citricoccus nitrophenolicus TaxID=863575 RepID=UPI0039B3EBE9